MIAKLLGALGDQDAAAREIASLTEGHPLALELIAGLADSPADLPRLVERLREKPTLAVLRLPGGEVREENMEACLALSYAALDTEMQNRFRALGVFAPAPFDRAAIRVIWGENDGEAVEDTVHYLTHRNLLTQAALAEEYQLYSLLRAYALALLEREGEHDTVAGRHADHYRQLAVESDWHAIESAYEQIDWGWRWVQNSAPDRILHYASSIEGFLGIRGRAPQRLTVLSRGLGQAQAANERRTEGALVNNIGSVYDSLGRKEEALDHYQQALTIRREVGDRGGESVTLFNIGLLLDQMSRTREAVTYLERNVALEEAIGHPDLENDRAILEVMREKLRNSDA